MQEYLLYFLVSLRQGHIAAEGPVYCSCLADQLSPDNLLLPHSACTLELHHNYLCNHTMYIIQFMHIFTPSSRSAQSTLFYNTYALFVMSIFSSCSLVLLAYTYAFCLVTLLSSIYCCELCSAFKSLEAPTQMITVKC